MTKTSKTIVFFGSGPVAEASLKALDRVFNIEAVITKPSTEEEMNQIISNTPVHALSSKNELTSLIQREKLMSPVGVVVDFGIIIEQTAIDRFRLGIINSHFSLLPEWRGADPITFAVLSGQNKTGVSLMRIVDKLDEGPLIAQKSIDIDPQVTAPQLTDQLIALSNEMLIHYLPKYIDGKVEPQPQPDRPASYSRKLTKQDGNLDCNNKTATQLEREVRAFLGFPRSRLTIFGHSCIITKASVVNSPDTTRLVIKCKNNSYLSIDNLIAPSGKKLDADDFLRGYAKQAR